MDFDQSVHGDRPNSGFIQAEVYRAPEVILDACYSYSADIWSLGVMLWDVLEDKKLFRDVYSVDADEYDELGYLAHITALLGPPQNSFWTRERGHNCSMNPEVRNFKGQAIPQTAFNFENVLSHMEGKDKRMFIEFVKRMIKWDPGERSTARELLQDAWLYAKFDED